MPILSPDPSKHPTLLETLAFPHIEPDITPPFIPTSAHDVPPYFRYLTRPMSMVNLMKLKKAVWPGSDAICQP
jgi:cell cycle serine/threonine-protein kinase CDC5/MSD2